VFFNILISKRREQDYFADFLREEVAEGKEQKYQEKPITKFYPHFSLKLFKEILRNPEIFQSSERAGVENIRKLQESEGGGESGINW